MKLPADFQTKYTKLLGDQATDFLRSFSEPSTHGFRINPLKPANTIHIDESHPTAHCKFGFYGEVDGKSPEHTAGLVYSQEPSAMYVGEVAHPSANEKVLDLCAAPGGKTTHLGSYMKNTGLLVANEIDSKRAKVLVENVERFGFKNTIVTNTDPEKMAKTLPNYFDRLLVDAPCSGEGMFRKDPDATKYWNIDYPKKCAKRQKEILTEAVKNLRPGGTLIYSTCTFSPEEDEQIISWLVKEHHFIILPIKKFPGMDSGRPDWSDNNPELTKCVRIFPHHFQGEGHFIAKLQKPEKEIQFRGPKPITKNPNINKMNSEQMELWANFANGRFSKDLSANLVVFKNNLYSVPDDTPDFGKIRIVRLGLEMGEFKKSRFEPSYGLALSEEVFNSNSKIEISFDEWKKYVHGDTFSVSGADNKKGWYLLTFKALPIGFGKLVGNTIKNFFPKGLRYMV